VDYLDMFLIFYHFLMTLIVSGLIPVIPFFNRERIRARLALDLPDEIPFQPPIWVHALSVGEVISAIPLVEALKRRYPEQGIVVSVTTRQGMALAQAELKDRVDTLLTMPVDFWWSVHRAVNRLHPVLFVLVETDIWPGLIHYLERKGVKSILVNGRISPSANRSYGLVPCFAKRLFELFERCMMQSDLDRDRLLNLGLDGEKIETSGNIKFDRPWLPMGECERQQWLEGLKLGSESILLVAGSTHPGEERIVLEAFRKLHHEFNKLRLLLAPRNIERAGEIKRLVEASGFTGLLKTNVADNSLPYQVLILDTVGELARLYGLARIGFVGGSLLPFGGHNLLEPASFGCPVFFGPHTENFVQMAEDLVRAGGGKRVHDAKELFEMIKLLLANPELARSMGDKAEKFVLNNQGAMGRVMTQIDHLLPSP
jgi:3-deoxy-D-manno-octulosonic-acid transferase